jgi:hypothetical protein
MARMVQEGVYSDSLLYSDEDDLQVNPVVAFPDNFVAARLRLLLGADKTAANLKWFFNKCITEYPSQKMH